MGAEDRKLWQDLDVSEEKSCIQHPTDKRRKVNFFADVPHLSKLARNHWLDSGLSAPLGLLNKELLEIV